MMSTTAAPIPAITERLSREKSTAASLSRHARQRAGRRTDMVGADAALGTDAAAAALPLREHGAARPPRRGGRLHGHLDGRDPGPRRVHAAGSRRRLDRARPPRHRRRRRLHPRAGAARPAGGRPRRRQRRALRARDRRLLGPHRRGLERDDVRAAAVARSRRPSTSCAPPSPASGPTTGFKLEQAPAAALPIVLAALRGKMLRLAVEKADGAFTNFLPLSGLPKVTDAARRGAGGLRARLPLLLPARRARGGRAAGAVHVLLLHHRPRLRGVLPLARPRRADRRDGRRLAAKDRAGRRGGAPWELIEDIFIFGRPRRCASASSATWRAGSRCRC